jgi:hypothetical protein
MSTPPGKAPKKEKPKRQTPAERAEALRYNHMMYGPTAGEFRPAVKKVNYGSAYLQHPKFQSLIMAFKKGTAFHFDVVVKGKIIPIATDGEHITFDGRTIYYSRPCNRYEDHLLLDREATLHNQTTDALVHLVFAVLRSFPEFAGHTMAYRQNEFYWGAETLEAGVAAQGPNLLIGSFRHAKVQDKPKN